MQHTFAHLLDSIFPEGHTDRDKPISTIIKRDYQQCHSGGTEEESHGLGDGAEKQEDTRKEDLQEEGYIGDEELELLVAAAEDATTR